MKPSPIRLRPLPRPGVFTYERRKQRSNFAATALELAYTSAANRANLDAIVLVDDEGMVVAKNVTDLDLSMLAAVTPIVGRGKAVPRIRRNGQERQVSIEPLELLGEKLYMAAVGGDPVRRLRELEGSVAATQRILA